MLHVIPRRLLGWFHGSDMFLPELPNLKGIEDSERRLDLPTYDFQESIDHDFSDRHGRSMTSSTKGTCSDEKIGIVGNSI